MKKTDTLGSTTVQPVASATGHPEPKSRWRILKSGLFYFVIVFTVGFILGPIRVLWAVPRFGTRWGELMEMPLMLGAIFLAAQWVVHRLAVPPKIWARMGMGLVALGLLLIAEVGLVFQLRGLSIPEYLAGRDPVSGTVYLLMLCVFAAMPWLVAMKHESIPLDN